MAQSASWRWLSAKARIASLGSQAVAANVASQARGSHYALLLPGHHRWRICADWYGEEHYWVSAIIGSLATLAACSSSREESKQGNALKAERLVSRKAR